MKVFPVALVVDGRRCLVIGSGASTLTRALALREAGANVTVIGTDVSPDVAADFAGRGIHWLRRTPTPDDFAGVFLAEYTDRDSAAALHWSQSARTHGALFCAEDQPAQSSFHHPAIAQCGSVQIAISTSGLAPALASRIREGLDASLGNDLAEYAARLAQIRDATPAGSRRDVLRRATEAFTFRATYILPAAASGDQATRDQPLRPESAGRMMEKKEGKGEPG